MINASKRIIPLFLPLIFSFQGISQDAAADASSKELKGHLLGDTKLIMDGKVDEEFWLNIPGSDGFRMQEPVEGGEATERTEIRVAFDDENIYISAILFDSDPSGIKAFQRKRDASLRTDDRFMWIFDTFNDKRKGYFFETNPLGLRGDGLLGSGSFRGPNKDWNGIWKAWTHIGDFGWSVEIRIPFRSLNFDPNSDTWSINFQRTIRRKNEELLWTGYRRNQGLRRPQNAGVLSGLQNPSQGAGLEIVPYGIVQSGKTYDEDADEQIRTRSKDFGFDVNYNITPSLKASFTYNTDFAQTEVDDRQINLTRFPLRFPEKRDFFLEGTSILSFASRSGVDAYFSRSIGLVDGNPIPINYGGRLLGNIGLNNVALLHVRTSETAEVNPESFTIARYRRNFWKESSVGFLYTLRTTDGDELLGEEVQDRKTYGADITLNTSKFLKNKVLQFSAFYLGHNPESPLNDSTSIQDRSVWGFRFFFPNRPWSAWVSFREFGDAYNPAVGFNRRNGYRRVQPGIFYSPLFENSNLIREVQWSVFFEHLTSLDNELLTQNLRIKLGEIRFESGERFEVELTRNFEFLDEDFDILQDGSVIVIPGEYVTWNYSIGASTASFRKVSGSVEYEAGGFWTGDISSLELGLEFRPIPGINFSTEYRRSTVEVESGGFDTNLMRLNLGFDFTPDLSLSTNIQYDDLSEVIGTNTRLRWIVTPGSDVFIVYNHNWLDNPADRWFTIQKQVAIKAAYTHRF